MSSSDLLSLANQENSSERLVAKQATIHPYLTLYLFKGQFLSDTKFSVSEESHVNMVESVYNRVSGNWRVC